MESRVAASHNDFYKTVQDKRYLNSFKEAGFATIPKPSGSVMDNPRSYKMRVDYQSKINCMPNSLTLQLEDDKQIKKRSKSTLNVRKDLHTSNNFMTI